MALGFRQGVGDTSGSGYVVTGYYLAVNSQLSQYVLYSVDHAGVVSKIASGALAAQPPVAFQMGALFNGTTITVFVNGQAMPSIQDSAYGNGWVAACSDGSSAFSHVKLYAAA